MPIGVVYGIDAVPDSSYEEVLEGLAQRNITVDQESGASTHAKVIISGARDVFVFSKNILSASHSSNLFEVGIVAKGADVGLHALEWFSELCSPRIRPSLEWEPDELGWMGVPAPAYPLPPSSGLPLSLVEIVEAVSDRQKVGPSMTEAERLRGLVVGVREWLSTLPADTDFVATWEDVRKLLIRLHSEADEAGLAVAEMVPTASHRRVLFDVLETARSRVIITSHKLGLNAFGPNLRSAISAALTRGVDVVLVWGERPTDAAVDVLNQLRQESLQFPGTLSFNSEPTSIHSKLLLADDRDVLVTSYELLHFADSQRYVRSELGLRVCSERLSAAIVHGLADHVSMSDPVLAEILKSDC